MGNQLFAAVLGLDLAFQLKGFSNCQSNFRLIHLDRSYVFFAIAMFVMDRYIAISIKIC